MRRVMCRTAEGVERVVWKTECSTTREGDGFRAEEKAQGLYLHNELEGFGLYVRHVRITAHEQRSGPLCAVHPANISKVNINAYRGRTPPVRAHPEVQSARKASALMMFQPRTQRCG
jgi:hypothetical protein